MAQLRNFTLNRLLDWWFVAFGPVDGSGDDGTLGSDARFAAVSVQVQELAQVELGLLQDLNLADVHVVKGVDALAGLFNVFADGVRDQLADNLCFHIKHIS